MANQLCHFELMTTDPEKAQTFYGSVFDWQFDTESMPGYTLVDTGGEPTGAIFPKPEAAPGPCVNVYFQVADMDATLVKVKEHGGIVLVEKTAIPGVGFFAMLKDPEGLVLGIMQPEG
ncbi:MAG: VOC family protein [Phycisphaerae bacterium]